MTPTSSSPTDSLRALSPGNWIDFGPAADIYDVSAILNPDTGLANVLANFSDPKSDGRETINGVETREDHRQRQRRRGQQDRSADRRHGPVPAPPGFAEDGNHELVQAQMEPSAGNSIR